MKKKYFILSALLFFSSNSVSAAAPPRSAGPCPATQEPELPSIDQLADAIIAQKEESRAGEAFLSFGKDQCRQLFAKIEELLRQGQAIKKYKVAGNVGYEMSLQEIKNFIQEKFQQMRKNKQLLTQQEFKAFNKDKWFWKGSDLTRIWGAEYLAEKFAQEQTQRYAVPKYIIVVEDLSSVQVKIHMGTCFPIIAEIKNGEIYASKIEGSPVASAGQHQKYGYTDTSAADNVIRNSKDGLDYYVDTEYKSFYDGQPENTIYKGQRYPMEKCDYLQRRFKHLNKIEGFDETVTVSVED